MVLVDGEIDFDVMLILVLVLVQNRVFSLYAEQPRSAWDHLCSY